MAFFLRKYMVAFDSWHDLNKDKIVRVGNRIGAIVRLQIPTRIREPVTNRMGRLLHIVFPYNTENRYAFLYFLRYTFLPANLFYIIFIEVNIANRVILFLII